MFRILVILFVNKYKNGSGVKGVWGAGYFSVHWGHLLAKSLQIGGVIAVTTQVQFQEGVVHSVEGLRGLLDLDLVVPHADDSMINVEKHNLFYIYNYIIMFDFQNYKI